MKRLIQILILFIVILPPAFAEWSVVAWSDDAQWEYDTARVKRTKNTVEFWLRQSGKFIREQKIEDYGDPNVPWKYSEGRRQINCDLNLFAVISDTDFGHNNKPIPDGTNFSFSPPYKFFKIEKGTFMDVAAEHICSINGSISKNQSNEKSESNKNQKIRQALPDCPKPDRTKKTDFERVREWNNCFGKYAPVIDSDYIGDVWEGEWTDGSLTGKGYIKYKEGNWYRGEILNFRPSGYGEWNSADGEKYVGNFVQGSVEGMAVYTNKHGERYEGEFSKSYQHGKGTYLYKSGAKYVGDWRNGKKNGIGIYTKPDGTTYEGNFVDDKFVGNGTSSGLDFFMARLIGCDSIKNDCLQTSNYSVCMQMKAPSCSK